MLHNEPELFEKVILDCAENTGIVPVIIEKDYYVTLFLKEITGNMPNIVFKGGTSLSKCYHLINRFSEDIDLTLEGMQKPTEGQRKHLVTAVKATIDKYGFTLKNEEDIRSRRDFNRFEIDVNSLFSSAYVKHDLIVETAVFMRSYPSKIKPASSYICEYLSSIGRTDIIAEYDLQPFDLQVQSLERTFIDKLFALCDYYLNEKTDEHSRHLYDLYKIYPNITVNESLKQLFNSVREERKVHKACPSAQEGIDIRTCLSDIIRTDAYKHDYENITAPLIFDDVSYREVKENLEVIANSKLF